MPAPIAGLDGAWACVSCQNVNFATRTACNRCQYPKQEGGAMGGCMGGWTAGPPAGGKGPPIAGVDGNWACKQCPNVNFPTRTSCNRCQAPRQSGPAASVNCGKGCGGCFGGGPAFGFAPQGPAPWGKGAGKAMSGGGKMASGAPIAGLDGNWMCPGCQNVNFASRSSCNRCQGPKVEQDQQMAPSARMPSGAPVAGVGGNWECVDCHNVNFAARTACNRCQAPRQEVDPSAPPAAADPSALPTPPAAKSTGAPVAGIDGNWACPGCGNVNFASRTSCNRCQTPKPMANRTPSGAPVPGVDGNWGCSVCGNVNFPSRTNCNRCQAPAMQDFGFAGRGMGMMPPMQQMQMPMQQGFPGGGKGGPPMPGVDGNWSCPGCNNVNWGVRTACNRCQTPKPAAARRASGAPVAGVEGNWACALCQNVNFPSRDVCNRCQASKTESTTVTWNGGGGGGAPGGGGKGGAPVEGVDGNWGCTSCSNVNFASREVCNRCQTPKPTEEEMLMHQLFFEGGDEPPSKKARAA